MWLAVLAMSPAASVDPVELRQLIQEEVQRAVAPLLEEVAHLKAENARLAAAATQQMRASVSPMGGTGRRLTEPEDSSSASCCRWTAANSCGSHTRQCTKLHEYLEAKTTTHDFANVEHANCLGSDSGSTWGWEFDGSTGNVTLSSDGSAVTSFKTPLKVSHAQNCSATPPALTLQMDTDVDGALTVGGVDVAVPVIHSETGTQAEHPAPGAWPTSADVPGLTKTFTLDKDSKVLIWYVLSNEAAATAEQYKASMTVLHIDDVEITTTRSGAGINDVSGSLNLGY